MTGYLNTRLRKYFSERKMGNGQTTKEIGTCPAYPVPDKDFQAAPGSTTNNAYNYAVNNSELTAPNYYFGFTHGGVTSWPEWLTTYGNKGQKFWPKRLSRVLAGRISPAAEWMLADAFRRPLPKGSFWPAANEPGSEMFPAPANNQNEEWGSLSPAVQVPTNKDASGKAAPHAPFHPSKGGFKRVQYKGATVTRFFGKVNTLYFDMHVQPQEGWKGTIAHSADPLFKNRLD
jgi:hypothetical protein